MNGSFIVRQRMPVQTPTNYNDNDFVEDRWAISSDNSSEINGVEVTVQDSNSGPLNQRSVLRVRQGTATATTAKLIQHIELNTQGDQFPFQVGTQWTLSFWYSGATDFTTQSCRAIFRTGGGISNNQLLAAPNDTGFVTQTDGSWNKYVFTFTIDGDMSVDPNQGSFTCLDIVINNFDITASSFFTDIQFEPGPVATPFELRPIGVELALCQRYFQKLVLQGGTVSMGNDSDRTARTPQRLSTKMRDTPTVENLVKDTAATRILQNGNTTTVSAPSQVIARADDLIEVNTIAANGSLATVRYTNASVDLVAEL